MSLLDYIERHCPYCGEPCLLAIDRSQPQQDQLQEYTEDCQVCCKPMRVSVIDNDPDQAPQVTLRSEDE